MTSPRLQLAACALAAGFLGNAGTVGAQSAQDDFWLEASVYMPKISSSVQVTSTRNPAVGSRIDLEDDLGFDDDETLPAFVAGGRVSRRFSIIGEYFSIDRNSAKALERDITLDGVTYPVSANLESGFKTNVYRLVMGYSFVRNDKAEVGAALGLHATDFKFAVEGLGTTGTGTATLERRAQDFLAPLPTLGLFASYEVAPGLTLAGRADYLSLSIDDYDGRLLNAQAKVSYRVWKNIGVGAAWRHVDYRVDVEKERYTGRFKYKFSGPALFLELGF